MKRPDVAIVMGSISDLETMQGALDILKNFKVPFVARVLSAHRTPKDLEAFVVGMQQAGVKAFIAGAGGAAALPGVVASFTTLPVLGVPIETKALKGLDSLLSIVQMPAGIPVATFAIGKAGAKNAALFAVSLLALEARSISGNLKKWRAKQAHAVRKTKIKI
ncbi:MAG: 5-(carboxyamino)imidazole ribonucleotide mutase [Candidatus Omnitrophota bacterium]